MSGRKKRSTPRNPFEAMDHVICTVFGGEGGKPVDSKPVVKKEPGTSGGDGAEGGSDKTEKKKKQMKQPEVVVVKTEVKVEEHGGERQKINILQAYIQLGQGRHPEFFWELLKLIGVKHIHLLSRVNQQFRGVVLSSFANEQLMRTIKGLHKTNPAIKCVTTEIFEMVRKGMSIPLNIKGSNFYPPAMPSLCDTAFYVKDLALDQRLFKGLYEKGDLCIERGWDQIVRGFENVGWTVGECHVCGVLSVEEPIKNGELDFTLRLVIAYAQVDTPGNGVYSTILQDPSIDLDELPVGCNWRGDVIVRARKNRDGSAEVVSVVPVEGSMVPMGADNTPEALRMNLLTLQFPRNRTERMERFENTMRRLLAGCDIPPGMRTIISVIPLENLSGDEFDDLQVGTVVLAIVGKPRDAVFQSGALDDMHGFISVLVAVQGDQRDGYMDLKVLRVGKGLWIPCIVDGRPVMVSDSRDSPLALCFLDVDSTMDKMDNIIGMPLLNMRTHPDFVKNFEYVIAKYSEHYIWHGYMDTPLQKAFTFKSITNGLDEVLDFDLKSVRLLFKCAEEGAEIGKIAQICLREGKVNLEREALVREVFGRIRTANDALRAIHAFIHGHPGLTDELVQQFISLTGAGAWDHLACSAYLSSDYAGKSMILEVNPHDFRHILRTVQTCIPRCLFLVVRNFVGRANGGLDPMIVARVELCLKWCFEKYPSISKDSTNHFMNPGEFWGITNNLQQAHKGLFEIWAAHFKIEDMDELQRNLQQIRPEMGSVLHMLSNLKISLSALVPKIEGIEKLAEEHRKSGAVVEFGTVEYAVGNGTRMTMSTTELMELVKQLNEKLGDYSLAATHVAKL